MYPAWMLKEMKRICDASDVLLNADEIKTAGAASYHYSPARKPTSRSISPAIRKASREGGFHSWSRSAWRILSTHTIRKIVHAPSFIRLHIQPIHGLARRISGRIRRRTGGWAPSSRCKNGRSSHSAPIRVLQTSAGPEPSQRSIRKRAMPVSRRYRPEASEGF